MPNATPIVMPLAPRHKLAAFVCRTHCMTSTGAGQSRTDEPRCGGRGHAGRGIAPTAQGWPSHDLASTTREPSAGTPIFRVETHSTFGQVVRLDVAGTVKPSNPSCINVDQGGVSLDLTHRQDAVLKPPEILDFMPDRGP